MFNKFFDLIISQIEFLLFYYRMLREIFSKGLSSDRERLKKMLGKFFLIWFLFDQVNSDWVKLPEISNTPKGNYKIQSVSSLSDFKKSSILGNSDVMGSVFSYDPPKFVSSTTQMTLILEPTHFHRSNTKKYFASTVTSKIIEIKPAISDRIDHDQFEMEAVKSFPKENSTSASSNTNGRVIFLNHTMPLKVHPTQSSGKQLTSTQQIDDDDDDGVTIVSEDESLDSEDDDDDSYEEDYEFEYETEAQKPKPQPSSTKAPVKAPMKAPTKKLLHQRFNDAWKLHPKKQNPKTCFLLRAFLNF